MAEMTLRMLLLGQDVSASKALKGVGTAADQAAGKHSKFGTVAGLAGAAAGLAALKFGKDSVSAYTDAQTQQAKLSLAFKKFPALADTNAGALRKLNTQLEAKTKFDDDATASGQATLAGFKLTGTQITQLTPLLQDYAAKTGKDLPTAAQDLGKAMLGQGRALKGVGINFKDTGSASGNFSELMGGLNAKVGGFATNEGKTAAGQAAILKNQFGEVQEAVGAKLVPALTKLAQILLSVIGFVQRNGAVIGPLVAILGGLAAVVYTIITAQKIWNAVMLAWDVIVAANPIVLIIIGLVALAAAIVIAYKRSATFRAIVTGAFNAVKAAAQAVWNWIKGNFPKLLGILTAPFKAAWPIIKAAWGLVTTLFSGAKKLVGKALSGIGKVITAPFAAAFGIIMAGIHAIEAAFNAVKSALGGGGPSLSSLPQGPGARAGMRGHAAGGIFTRPALFGNDQFGEAGPEALIPLASGRGRSLLGGGGDTYNIHFHALTDSASAAREIEAVMQDKQRRTGRPAQFRALTA